MRLNIPPIFMSWLQDRRADQTKVFRLPVGQNKEIITVMTDFIFMTSPSSIDQMKFITRIGDAMITHFIGVIAMTNDKNKFIAFGTIQTYKERRIGFFVNQDVFRLRRSDEMIVNFQGTID